MLALHTDFDRAVKQLGWTQFTPVQELSIPPLRSGRDLLAQAQTGTGKTAAFALPVLERITARAGAPFALRRRAKVPFRQERIHARRAPTPPRAGAGLPRRVPQIA